jgi:3-hydroxyacyl-CoA dehydrogenase
MKKLDPAPFAAKDRWQYIEVANYGSDLARLGDCDLVIEAIAEKMEWKLDLYAKVAPHLKAGAIFASNTSGLSIEALAAGMPGRSPQPVLRHPLLQPAALHAAGRADPDAATDAGAARSARSLPDHDLGKSIVRAKDTPNFVANRVGVFSILAVLHHTARLGLAFDEVDR